jgi:hypothetical protein
MKMVENLSTAVSLNTIKITPSGHNTSIVCMMNVVIYHLSVSVCGLLNANIDVVFIPF